MERRALRSLSIQVYVCESTQFPRDFSADNFCHRSFQHRHRISAFFFEERYVRLDLSTDDAVFFCENSRNLGHPGKWSNARCDTLTASVFALICQKSSTCAKRDTTLVNARCISFQRQFVCRRLFASGHSMHQLQDSFLSHQPSRIVFVEMWRAEKSDQLLDIQHCAFWISFNIFLFPGNSQGETRQSTSLTR